jgi:hypothetical protein
MDVEAAAHMSGDVKGPGMPAVEVLRATSTARSADFAPRQHFYLFLH